MSTVYLVWNTGMNECVGFTDKKDADWTAKGGRHPDTWTPTIGEAFREAYGDEQDRLPQTEIDVPEAEA